MNSAHSHSFKNETPTGFAVLTGLLLKQPKQRPQMSKANRSATGPVRQAGQTTRHANFDDKTGRVFGRLTAVSYAGKLGGDSGWNCLCSCGTWVLVAGGSLNKGISRSCGCLQREEASEKRTTHGKSKTELYRIWSGIRTRCFNSEDHSYRRYGGRGITLHPSFSEFQGFSDYVDAALGPRPTKRHSIDRIENDKGYEPGNLRWATATVQNRNTSRAIYVDVNGSRIPLAQATEGSEVGYNVAANRLALGWSEEEALATPVGQRRGSYLQAARHVTVDGRRLSVTEAAKAAGLRRDTVVARLNSGWSDEDALSTPAGQKRSRSHP